VITRAFRLCKTINAPSIWTGIGARDYGGRWNSKGVAVVYTAESGSLAALEQLVHQIKPRVLKGFVLAQIEFDDSQVQRVAASALPADWDAAIAPTALRRVGDDWVAARTTPVLAIPSALIPGEWNYLFNPSNVEFAAMAKTLPRSFTYDDRMG
jgi:RES domain-containing protein